MKYLDKLYELECFTYDDVLKIIENVNSANSLLRYYKNNKSIIRIRKGLYSVINPIDKSILANKYLIGSKISKSSVISHFSAFEFYGYYNQVSYRVSVSSKTKFNKFNFDGFEYVRLPMIINAGIVELPNGIKITDLERTIVDTINDYEKLLGFEELIKCLSMIPMVDETKLLKYLKEYNKKYLYQKVGFILEHFKEELNLSDDFFKTCVQNIGSSSRYLLKNTSSDDLICDGKWRLTYPKNLWVNVEGANLDADL